MPYKVAGYPISTQNGKYQTDSKQPDIFKHYFAFTWETFILNISQQAHQISSQKFIEVIKSFISVMDELSIRNQILLLTVNLL